MLNGLTPTPGEPLSFAEDVHIRAFTLDNGFVVYAAPGVSGPARAQYLNHWHEAKFGGGFADAPLYVHEADAPWVDAPHTTFSGRATLDGGFETIPMPGHTPGATAFLWNGYLFTGDSVYLDGDEWRAAVLDSSDRQAYIDSLERLKTVDFEYLVPWAASASGPWYSPAHDRVRRFDAILERLRRGEDR
jgi:glyoxylase-like metal-dependent hydrolase (beta-lactamase superfamily II)